MSDNLAQTSAPVPPPPTEKPAPPAPTNSRRKLVIGAIVLVLVLVLGIPKVLHALHTASTDDAYVNSYVTFVAPRVAGQVAQVLVDDNNRVKKGDVLVELDPEPYKVVAAIKQAAVTAAEADRVVAEANVRGEVGRVRGLRFTLQHAIEDVNNQVATLRAVEAKWEQSKASVTLAESEFARAQKLLATKVTSPEEFEQKREAVEVARAQVKQSLEAAHQARAALGLPVEPPAGGSLTDVPADLDQTYSSVRSALAQLMQGAAGLGIVTSSYDLTPKQVVDEFYQRDPGGDINKIYADVIKNAPGLKTADAALLKAQRDLDQAKLDLRYCSVVSEIDGVVTRRNVNPGNNVQVGQNLMAVRSLKDLWIDANYKETQLRDLRIGQKVEIKADMYGKKRMFEGRVSGFTMGTGSTLALLPAQNATGNFVKVVQRLPVRIDLVNYNPDDGPLFVGTSVEPEIDLKSAPEGANAGKFLQDSIPAAPAK